MAAMERTAPSNGSPMVEGQVSLQVFRREGRYYIRVRVNGTLRPHIAKHTDLPIRDGSKSLHTRVTLAAAVCAEALCDDLKENVDPGATARAAGRAFNKLRGDEKLTFILG